MSKYQATVKTVDSAGRTSTYKSAIADKDEFAPLMQTPGETGYVRFNTDAPGEMVSVPGQLITEVILREVTE